MPRTSNHESLGIYLLLFLLTADIVCNCIAGQRNQSWRSLKSIAKTHKDSLKQLNLGGSGSALSLNAKFSNRSAESYRHLADFPMGTNLNVDPDVALIRCKGIMMKRNLIGEDVLLHKSTAPSIGEDGRVYACIGRNVYAFDTDGTVSWNAALNDTCEELLSPVVTTDGKVYVAANCRVIAVTYSQDLDLLSAWDLYNGTSLDGSMLGSKHITGLALIGNGTSLLINAGAAGLYAVSEDGSPLWSTNGDFKSKDIAFPPEIFCSEQDKICYFHFSPAVDDCDGSIYIVHTNGWLYAIDGWGPYVKWRYNIQSSGNTSVAGVTAGHNGRVYVATITGVLFSLDTITGQLIWKVSIGPLTNRTCFPKLDAKGHVILGSLDGFLYVVSPDGQRIRKYLDSAAENSIIHSFPYVDCAKAEIYVAQVSVQLKMMTETVITYLGAEGVTFFIVDAFSGYVLLSEYFPGESIANQDGILDASLLLSVFAANHSRGGICDTMGKWNCTVLSKNDLEGVPVYIGSNIVPVFIAVPLIFFVLAIMILIWFLLRKRYEHRYWQSLPPTVIDRNIVPSFQDLCHKRAIFEDKVSRLERLLKTNPDSTQLQVELQKAIEDLYKNECMISHFTWNARSNMDMEPLLQESVLHSPDMEMLVSSRQSCYGFTNEAGPYGISATFNQYELSNKRSDYSQTSFNSMHGSFDMTLSRKFSSNPLFKASESQKRLMVPEFKTQDNHYYGIPDLENGCSHPDLLGDPYAQQDTDSSLRPDVYLSDDGIELTDMTGKNYSTYGCPSYEIHSVNFDEYGRDMNAYYHNTEFESGRKQQDEEMQIQKSTGEQNSQPSSDDTSIECNKDPSLQLGIYENNIWEETNVINADNRTCDQSLTGLSETKIIDMKGQMASPQTSNMRESDPSAETSKNMEPIQGKTLNGADNFFLNEETNQLSANPPSPAIAELETFSEHEPTHEGFTDTSSSIPTRPILPYGQHPASQSSESFFSQKILSLINSQCERCISEIGELDTVHGMLNISEFKSQSAGSQLPETEPGPSHIPRASQSLRIKDEKSRMWQEGGKNLQTNHHQNVEDFGNKIYATGHENTEDHMSQGNEMSLYTQYQGRPPEALDPIDTRIDTLREMIELPNLEFAGEICANDGETESQKRSTMDLDAERRRSSGESGLIARKSQVNDRAAGKQSLNWNDSVVSSLSGVSAVGGSVERSDTIGKNSREGVDAPRCSLEENYVLGIRSLHDSSVVKEGSLEVSDAIAEAKEILLETNTRYESTQSAREETTSVVTLEPSVSPSSQSSNQSTPRSLVTSISEQAESLNSKASTVTDFSDTESSDKSDKSDKSDLGNSGSFWQDQMDTSSVLAQQNATTRQADLPDWHVSPPIREVSSRRPFNHPDIVFTCENQENLDSEESSFSTMSSSSQLHEQQQADWFSIPGLSLAELRSIDSRNSESENRGLIHDGSMAANSSPSISFSRDTLSNWVYDDT